MTLEEMEKAIAELRSRPLLLVCRDRKGREKVMTLAECCRTGSVYVHVAVDDLDALLSAELGQQLQETTDDAVYIITTHLEI